MPNIIQCMIEDIREEERLRLREDKRKVLRTMARWACDPADRATAQAAYQREFALVDMLQRFTLAMPTFSALLSGEMANAMTRFHEALHELGRTAQSAMIAFNDALAEALKDNRE